jgi:hypothetical protein
LGARRDLHQLSYKGDTMLLNEDFQWIKEPKLHALLQSRNDRNDQSWVEEYKTQMESRNKDIRRIMQDADRREALEKLVRREAQSMRTEKENSVPIEITVPHDLMHVAGGSIEDIEEAHNIDPSMAIWWDHWATIPDIRCKTLKHMQTIEAEWREEERTEDTAVPIEAQGIVEFDAYCHMMEALQKAKENVGEDGEVTHEEIIEAFEAEYGCSLDMISETLFFGLDWRLIQENAIDGKDIIHTERQSKTYNECEAAEMKNDTSWDGKDLYIPSDSPHWQNQARH